MTRVEAARAAGGPGRIFAPAPECRPPTAPALAVVLLSLAACGAAPPAAPDTARPDTGPNDATDDGGSGDGGADNGGSDQEGDEGSMEAAGDADEESGGDAGDADGDAGEGGGPCTGSPEGVVSLPADDAAHDEPVEWWYWTGHLRTADGRWFGFEHVFFRMDFGGGGTAAWMVHHAVTDVAGGAFRFTTAEGFGPSVVGEDGFRLSLGGFTADGGGGHDTLHGAVDRYVLDIEIDAEKAPVLQHGDGYTDYSFGGYTYYYSRERMAARGTIEIGGVATPVSGAAWFDHQWGDLRPAIGHGWDWFAIQLDDGREIMLFVVRVDGTDVFVGGSRTDADCATAEIGPEDFEITPLGSWTGPESGCTYPMGWTVVVNPVSLTVTPVLQDQELRTGPAGTYWEGAAEVSGDAAGRAYIEMTGYCP